MNLVKNPRMLARFAGASYVAIIIFAAVAYLYVRAGLVISTDMARTGANLAGHEELYRLGVVSAVVTVICNLPVGLIFYELFKVVNQGLARALLVFITVSATIEAINLYNYITPLFLFTLPEYRTAFDPASVQALARVAGKLFGFGFSVSLAFFSIYCMLTGYLIVRSTFIPKLIGGLMIGAGLCYCINSFGAFLALPPVPYILWISFVAENSLAWWLLIMGVNEGEWRAQAEASSDRG